MSALALFEEKQVRRAWNQAKEKWYFAIVDVIAILTDCVDPGTYWRKLNERLKKDRNETVTNRHALKMVPWIGHSNSVIHPRQPVSLCNALRSALTINARKELEAQSGTRVSTPDNFKALNEALTEGPAPPETQSRLTHHGRRLQNLLLHRPWSATQSFPPGL